VEHPFNKGAKGMWNEFCHFVSGMEFDC